MPLLVSPIDGSPMRQIHRYGIELDVCPTSGGVWLDKGELEKILLILQEDLEAAAAQRVRPAEPQPQVLQQQVPHPQQQQQQPAYEQPRYRERDDDDRRDARYRDRDDDDHRYRERKHEDKYYKDDKYRGKPYKKDKMSRLFDVFDF